MQLKILIPYATLLECRLDTTVLVVDDNTIPQGLMGRIIRKQGITKQDMGVRRIGDVVTFYKEYGWDFLTNHLPREKQGTDWWERVRTIANDFRWGFYETPSLPTVKPHEGTLEFYGDGGNHRAMAVAIRGGQEPIPVILNL
jgi:hypothetical protein